MQPVIYNLLLKIPVGLVKTVGSLTFFSFPAILVFLGRKELSVSLLVLYGSITVCANIGVGWLEQSYMRFQDRSELLNQAVLIIISALASIILFTAINKINIGPVGYLAVIIYIVGEFQQRLLAVDFLINKKIYQHNLLILTRWFLETAILVLCLIPNLETKIYLSMFLFAFACSRICSSWYSLDTIINRRSETKDRLKHLKKSKMLYYGIWITLMVSIIQIFVNYVQNVFIASRSSEVDSLIAFSRYCFLAISLPYGVLLVAFTPKIFGNTNNSNKFNSDLEIFNMEYLVKPIPAIVGIVVCLIAVNYFYFKLPVKDVLLLMSAPISWSFALMSIKPTEIRGRSVDLAVLSFLSCSISYLIFRYYLENKYVGLIFAMTSCYVLFYFLQTVYQLMIKYTRIAFVNLILSSVIFILTCLGFLMYGR